MTIGPISLACRVFLSRNHLYPGHVSRQLLKRLPPAYRQTTGRLRLQGKGWDHPIAGGDEFNDACIEHDPRSGNILLKVKRKRFWYREHRDGVADLILFNKELPEVVCLGLERDRYRLTQLVQHEFDPFYLKSDPPVRSMRNAQRLGRRALVLRLLPTWSDDHWDYSDGRDGWSE